MTRVNQIWIIFQNSICSCKGTCQTNTQFTAVKISETEFILIFDQDQVAIYNVRSKFWTHLGYLRHRRVHSRAAFFKGKVIVTGGQFLDKSDDLPLTEIIDLSRREIRPGGNLNFGRALHGMATVTINEELKLITFGIQLFGNVQPYNPGKLIEVWNDEKEIWEVNENDGFRVDLVGIKFGYSTLTIPSYNFI